MGNNQSEKLAAALIALKKLEHKNKGVVESKDLRNEQRTILVSTGFLRRVIKGWYICTNPRDSDDVSTAWYASFWPFLSGYLSKRFRKRYCLNPEASLFLQTGSTLVPRQVVVTTNEGGGGVLNLPFGTSLLFYPDEKRVPKTRIEIRGLQVYPLAEALCLAPPSFFRN